MSPFARIAGCFILVFLASGLAYERALSTGARSPDWGVETKKQQSSKDPFSESSDVQMGSAPPSIRESALRQGVALLEVPAPPNLGALFPETARRVDPALVATANQPIQHAASNVVYQLVTSQMIARRSNPAYPAECERLAEDEEFISIRFRINERGWVESPMVVDATNDCFQSAAIRAARQTRFHDKNDARTIGDNFVLRYRFAKPDLAERIE